MPVVEVIDMRQEFLETRKHGIFSRALIEAVRERLANNGLSDDPAEPARVFDVRGV